MRIPSRRKLAWAATGLGIALFVAGQAANYAADPGLDRIFVLIAPAALLVGGLIAIRMPGNVYGWLWLLLGWGWGVLQPWGIILAKSALAAWPPRAGLAAVGVEMADAGWFMSLSMISMVILLYPTGRLPSPRWRILIWIVALAALLSVTTVWAMPGKSNMALIEHPFGIQGPVGQIAGVISFASVFVLFVSALPATVSLVFRYRGAAGQERAQLRWLAYAATLNIAYFIVDALNWHLPWVKEETMTTTGDVLILLLPLAVAIAILRYRLYDIDLIIRRTLVYGALTLTLALVFFGGVALLQRVFGRISGTEDTPVIIVPSTLVIAALFTPLKRRIQEFIDRRFYRRKYNAEQALEAFAAVARSETDLDTLTAKLVEVVNQTMQPEHVGVWLKPHRRQK